MKQGKQFIQTTRGKLILAFVLVLCVSLFTWIINRSAFDRINDVVEKLAQPNERLNALNRFQMEMSRMNDFYRVEALRNKPKPSTTYTEKIALLSDDIVRLKERFAGDKDQIRRLEQVDSVFNQRNMLFEKYLRTRYNYIHNGLVDKQFEELAQRVDRENLKIDTNVITSEKQTTTTTYYDPVVKQEITEKKRLFRRKKPEPVAETNRRVVVEEQLNVHVDTLAVSQKKDSILENIRISLDQVETERNSGRRFLQKQELILIQSNEILSSRLLELIGQVEREETLQTQVSAATSIRIARETIGFTKILTAVFVLVAFVLIGFIIGDISKFNRYRKQLEASRAEAEFHSQAKQRFLSNMSHEIRTPLQAIVGYSELMLKENAHDPSKVEAVAKASEHLLQVVNEILDYSRIVSNTFSIDEQPFQLQTVIDEVVEMAAFQCQQKGLDWITDFQWLPTENTLVVSDAFRIKQILINVLSNAVKYTPKGSVSMSVRAKEQLNNIALSIVVSDTGIGMDSADIRRIFQQFERAKNVDAASGTGLGLSIVKELMDALKGKVSVKSALAKGTTFQLDFTLRKAKEEQVPAIENNSDAPIAFDGVIWVVDDDPFILKLCEQLLLNRNLEYRCFDNPRELLATEWDERVKLIFADVRMPGMNGVELCKELRKKRTGGLTIIALTAQVMPDEKASFLKSGFDAIVMKPFKSHDFYTPILELASTQQDAFDFSALRSMIPDEEDFQSILQQFVNDSLEDMATVKSAMGTKNGEELLLVIHRLAGRTAQMGANTFGKQLRALELQLKAGYSEAMNAEIEMVVTALEKEIQQL